MLNNEVKVKIRKAVEGIVYGQEFGQEFHNLMVKEATALYKKLNYWGMEYWFNYFVVISKESQI